jgi:TatD DNase family protein
MGKWAVEMSTMLHGLVDSHVHLDEVEDVEAGIREAKEAGAIALVAVGQDHNSNHRVLELAERHVGFVYPALGLHPWNMGQVDSAELERVFQFIEDNVQRIVGIGEIGLDYHKRVRARADKQRQSEVFKAALHLAAKHGKPVSVHSRYAWKDSFDLVKESGVELAVFHWYTGFSNVLREIVAGGYFISATPAAEYHDEHRRAIKETPLENLLLETDAPVAYGRETRYQSRPADVVRSLGAVARLKGLDTSVVARQTTRNAMSLFGLDGLADGC